MSDKFKEINSKMLDLRNFFATQDLQVNENNAKTILSKFIELKTVMGNIHGNIHFLARYAAYSFLKKKHGVEIDLVKPEGQSGLDIEEKDIVGEIKTTIPYHDNDFGAKQREGIIDDLERLQKSTKMFKYFFVIDNETERILHRKYSKNYPNVVIINLLREHESLHHATKKVPTFVFE